MKLFRPEVFQGSIKADHYFEGWYLKHVSPDHNHVFSFIPGISLIQSDQHAFIQVIDGVSGNSWYIRYPLKAFDADRKSFRVSIGRSVFSAMGSEIDIESEGLRVQGRVDYIDPVRYPRSFLSPGIMGWYSFVPFMECKHGVVSVDHYLDGSLDFNGTNVNLTDGKGYIEKDWGTSFPAAWIWLHCNTFLFENASVMLSVAKIPWLGSYFMGFLCFLYTAGQFYLFSTYNGSKITRAGRSGKNIRLTIAGKKQTISFEVFPRKSGSLRAPHQGEMKRLIKESVDSQVYVRLEDRHGIVLYEGKGVRTGLEVTENIFDLLEKEGIPVS
jgi:tocopherol cyclase